jgi:hypothetical protein
MKKPLLIALAASCLHAPAATLLFSDNFNVGDTTNFDGASTAGRLGGTASGETAFQSFGSQQDITGGRLDLDGAGGVRFGPETSRYNWAGSTTGGSILTAGGFVVTFDWTLTTASNDWIGWKVGTANNDTSVIDASVDHSLLLRQNGGNERWDNGLNLGFSGTSFSPGATPLTIPVSLTYSFGSFADGSNVNLVAVVNGIQVVTDTFTWSGNSGEFRMELESGTEGNFVDNLAITTIPEPATGLLGLMGAIFLIRRRK